jgi:hypothetical protein
MDIYCPKCGEPCDTGEFSYMEENWGQRIEPNEAQRRFFALGCRMLFTNGEKSCGKIGEERKSKLLYLRQRRGIIDPFIKLHGCNGDYGPPGGEMDKYVKTGEDTSKEVQHPCDTRVVTMVELRLESWEIENEIKSFEELLHGAAATEALHDLLGDDIDGIASLLD